MSDQTSADKSGELVSAAIESDAELKAIPAILAALIPLKREGRTRVLDYVLKRLGMSSEPTGPTSTQTVSHSADAYVLVPTSLPAGQPNDIRSLTKQKVPRSANEMAALVAYYLAEVAPEPYRKQTITADDIKVYFKQAPFKLPSSAQMTLVNAKNAGYLEPSGEAGQYRLNPVGYNLVAHSLPAGTAGVKKIPHKKTKKKNPSRVSK